MDKLNQSSNIVIYGDGGSRGNPGEAAYGFAIFTDTEEHIYSEGKRIGINTNNVAEYMAVVSALRYVAANMPKVQNIVFRLDSLLVASQMNGKFKVKHPNMKDLFITAKRVEQQIPGQIIYTQIPREKNKVADSLVNAALDYKI